MVFRIRPASMTAQRLGLHVSSAAAVNRVDSVLSSFIGGFNVAITARTNQAWRRYCDGLPVLYQPFAHEGAAMGDTLRHAFRYDAAAFENEVVRRRPEYRYLYYVGLGFWSGMRRHGATHLSRVVAGLDPLHRYLCYDGYGFQCAFFDYRRDRSALRRLDALDGYARNAAYQGVGRAFYFLFMERPDMLIEHTRAQGEHAIDVAGGLGLAAAFVNPDRLDVAQELGGKLSAEWRDHFHLGMCFGLKARAINDVDRFESDTGDLAPSMREAVLASVRECDRVELQVRADNQADAYQRWRSRVTEWLAANVTYPMVGVRTECKAGSGRPPRVDSTD